MQWLKEKGQSMMYKILQRNLKIEQYKSSKNMGGGNSCALPLRTWGGLVWSPPKTWGELVCSHPNNMGGNRVLSNILLTKCYT